MADSTIFDLTPETVLTSSHEFVTQDTSAATRAQAATFALMGGLEHNAQTVTTADITGAVGQFYYCTIAGLTASRNLTLPASPNVGERIGVFIVDGDADYELIIKGAATVTINSGTAATEWSRLFIAGECVVFRATSSTNWVVEVDRRKACAAQLTAADDLDLAGSTWTDIVFASGDDDFDNANLIDYTINTNVGGFTIRRAGVYLVSGNMNVQACTTVTGRTRVGVSFKLNGTQEAAGLRLLFGVPYERNVIVRPAYVVSREFSAGDTFGAMTYEDASDPGNHGLTFGMVEIL